jgi:transglutaminase-like putative cysteine protease
MLGHRTLSSAWLIALAIGAGHDSTAAAKRAQALPEPYDRTYGIYLNGGKVGWMRSRLVVGREVTLETRLTASVGGMGKVSKVELTDQSAYDAQSGELVGVSFSQTATTGAVRVEGRVDKGTLKLSIQTGDSTFTQSLPVEETLAQALAVDKLAREGKIGASVTVEHFDPSIQKQLKVIHTVTAVDRRLFAGVMTRVIGVTSTYTELGIDEQVWLDETGKILESKVGGFFVARLEPPEVAQQLDYQQDLLVSAVVKAPRPIAVPEALQALEVTFSGFGPMTPPTSARQQVLRRGDEVLLTLSRDPALPTTPIAAVTAAARKAGLDAELTATPFIQSDADEIRSAARQGAGDAADIRTASERLTHWVFSYVRDEYVPAYSNALEALKSARGDCTEHAVLFVALARALGIPARVAVGIAYWPPGDGFGWHAWAEVWAGGRWTSVDPTWNQPIADVTHVKLADGGPAEQARIVMLLGRLKINAVHLEPAR